MLTDQQAIKALTPHLSPKANDYQLRGVRVASGYAYSTDTRTAVRVRVDWPDGWYSAQSLKVAAVAMVAPIPDEDPVFNPAESASGFVRLFSLDGQVETPTAVLPLKPFQIARFDPAKIFPKSSGREIVALRLLGKVVAVTWDGVDPEDYFGLVTMVRIAS